MALPREPPVTLVNGGCPPRKCSDTWLPHRAGLTMLTQLTASVKHVRFAVGANKGYKVPEFLSLWSQVQIPDYNAGWQRHLVEYARKERSGSLRMYSCGNCNECRAAPPLAHKRTGARIHLLEIAPVNQALLRYMLDSQHITGVVSLHAVGGSNQSQRVPLVRSMPPGEERQGILTDRKLERFNRANATIHVQTVALDDFFVSQSLSSIYQVSIDTEGWDALVVEGMRNAIVNRRVAVVEFEVNQMGYWNRNKPDHRTVKGTLSMFHAAGGASPCPLEPSMCDTSAYIYAWP